MKSEGKGREGEGWLMLSIKSLTLSGFTKKYAITLQNHQQQVVIEQVFRHNYEYAFQLWPCQPSNQELIKIKVEQIPLEEVTSEHFPLGSASPVVNYSSSGERFKFEAGPPSNCLLLLKFKTHSLPLQPYPLDSTLSEEIPKEKVALNSNELQRESGRPADEHQRPIVEVKQRPIVEVRDQGVGERKEEGGKEPQKGRDGKQKSQKGRDGKEKIVGKDVFSFDNSLYLKNKKLPSLREVESDRGRHRTKHKSSASNYLHSPIASAISAIQKRRQRYTLVNPKHAHTTLQEKHTPLIQEPTPSQDTRRTRGIRLSAAEEFELTKNQEKSFLQEEDPQKEGKMPEQKRLHGDKEGSDQRRDERRFWRSQDVSRQEKVQGERCQREEGSYGSEKVEKMQVVDTPVNELSSSRFDSKGNSDFVVRIDNFPKKQTVGFPHTATTLGRETAGPVQFRGDRKKTEGQLEDGIKGQANLDLSNLKSTLYHRVGGSHLKLVVLLEENRLVSEHCRNEGLINHWEKRFKIHSCRLSSYLYFRLFSLSQNAAEEEAEGLVSLTELSQTASPFRLCLFRQQLAVGFLEFHFSLAHPRYTQERSISLPQIVERARGREGKEGEGRGRKGKKGKKGELVRRQLRCKGCEERGRSKARGF